MLEIAEHSLKSEQHTKRASLFFMCRFHPLAVVWNSADLSRSKKESNGTHKRQQIKKLRGRRTTKGEPRLIPESDNIINEIRLRTKITADLIRTVKPYLGSARVSDDLAIANILCNLKHYCESEGLEFGDRRRTRVCFIWKKRSMKAHVCPPPILDRSSTPRLHYTF